jgi:hypothetical protein
LSASEARSRGNKKKQLFERMSDEVLKASDLNCSELIKKDSCTKNEMDFRDI